MGNELEVQPGTQCILRIKFNTYYYSEEIHTYLLKGVSTDPKSEVPKWQIYKFPRKPKLCGSLYCPCQEQNCEACTGEGIIGEACEQFGRLLRRLFCGGFYYPCQDQNCEACKGEGIIGEACECKACENPKNPLLWCVGGQQSNRYYLD